MAIVDNEKSNENDSNQNRDNTELSPSQSRIWFTNKILKDKSAYNISASIKVSGKMNSEAMVSSIRYFESRHDILRTRIVSRNNTVVHEYSDELAVQVEQIDISNIETDKRIDELRRIEIERGKTEFKLDIGPLWSCTMVKIDEECNYLIFVIHHIIADGWSLNVLIREISRFYRKINNNEIITEKPLPFQYFDIISTMEKYSKEDYTFWKEKLKNISTLNLPIIGNRPAFQTFQGKRFPISFSKSDSDALKEMANKHGVTLFILLISLYKLLLYRYSGNDVVTIGTPIANRNTFNMSKLIGLFMDSLVLSTEMYNCNLPSFMSLVDKNLKDGIAHKQMSFAEIVKDLNPVRDPSISPFFQVMFIFQNGKMEDIKVDDLVYHARQVDIGSSKFDLTLELYKGKSGLDGWFEYNTDLFDEDTISSISSDYIKLVKEVLKDSSKNIFEYDFISDDKKSFLDSFNSTRTDIEQLSVEKLFEKQVELNPDKIAVKFNNKEISYSELNCKANQIANYIKANYKIDSDYIGIYFNRSIEMIVSVLAVLKAGYGYLPMDPIFPKDRLHYMAEDSDISILLCDGENELSFFNEKVNCVNINKLDLNDTDKSNSSNNHIDKNAYIIYTSGSTGKPKGVEIGQLALTNFLQSMSREPGITSDDKLLAVTTLSFDISKLEIFLPLITGSTTILASKNDVYSGKSLLKLITENDISIMQGTPSTWKMLIDAGWNKGGIKALCGGEALPKELAKQIVERAGCLWNMYGPTETTIWSSIARIDDPEDISIGKPIANTTMYVLDKNNELAPLGVAGELCIGGIGLANGYHNRTDLTNEKFSNIEINGKTQKLYRTGDLVKFDSKRKLVYLERIDNQVKIRGYRIELGEIESHIRNISKIDQTVVVAKELKRGDKVLVAYYVSKKLDINNLKKSLKNIIPEYMIPSYFIELDKFPLTPNGKIDKKNLPLPDESAKSSEESNENINDIEKKIITIWQSILNRSDFTVKDNFFDVGGHSLLLGQLHIDLEELFNIKFELIELFDNSNIKSQADFVSRKKGFTKEVSKKIRKSSNSDDIAIIGISCRVPGAKNRDEFFNNLKNGVNSITHFTDDELLSAGVEPETLEDKNFVKAWGKLDGIEDFDADFFGYTPREAEIIDPQQRVFLEECYRTLEDGGYSHKAEEHNIGIFAGTGMNSYLEGFGGNSSTRGIATNYQYMISNDKDFLASRVAYKLNLKGPAISVQTACSTSLVALHLACNSIKNGESDLAIAGGVSIRMPQDRGYIYQEGMILSPDGNCRAFDEHASGTVGGNGAGAVLLKRYSEAKKDGDQIYAVVKASAINNDGQDKIGYTAPGITGQFNVISEAMEKSGLKAEDISFIENHGTGTKLGDPVEVNALKKVYRETSDKNCFCGLTSVKSNIGHLDAASGIIGVIKSSLALKHNYIFPTLNFSKPNPKLDIDNSPFYINDKLKKWDAKDGLMRCGVSSFGIGGTNAHAILEQHVNTNEESKAEKSLLLFSAKSELSLNKNIEVIGNCIDNENLNSVSSTLALSRTHFDKRAFTVIDPQKIDKNFDFNSSKIRKNEISAAKKNSVFLFPGQGSQYVNMAKDLYLENSDISELMDNCFQLIDKYSDFNSKQTLFSTDSSIIDETWVTQPLLFMVEYVVAKYLISIGIEPEAMIGHSLGEYVCGCLAGVFSLEDAIKLVVARGRIMYSQPKGDMIAIFESKENIEPLLTPGTSISVINTPNLLVISGSSENISHLKEVLKNNNIISRNVKTSHAFHCPMMDGCLDEFRKLFTDIKLNTPKIKYLSNVTGDWIKDSDATDSEYWVSHLRNRVEFSKGLNKLLDLDNCNYIEVGPGNTISGFIKMHDNKIKSIQTIRHHSEIADDNEILLEAIGKLWINGANLNLPRLFKKNNISIPPYQFEKNRYWKSDNSDIQSSESKNKRLPIEKWLNVPSWIRSPISRNHVANDSGIILFFVGSNEINGELVDELVDDNRTVLKVSIGSDFTAESNSFTINPENPNDYELLFKYLKKEEMSPGKIVHGWNMSIGGSTKELSFYSLVYIAKYLNQSFTNIQSELIVLTSNVHQVSGIEELDPLKSLINGPVRVIPQEYPSIKCRSIDFSLNKERGLNISLDRIVKEIEVETTDQFIAYRGNYRYKQGFEQVELPEENLEYKFNNGVYLITGGTGGLGKVFAKEISVNTDSKIILLGNSDIPDKKEWSKFDNIQGKVSDTINFIKELENQGSEVYAIKADISNSSELKSVISEIELLTGEITDVIHAAGVPGGGLIDLKSSEEAERVFGPKIDGTINIDSYFKNRNLNSMVLFSSVTSICGGIGQVDYSSANSFIDSYVLSNQNRPYPFISINWDTWKESGMALTAGNVDRSKEIYNYDEHQYITGFSKISENQTRYYGQFSIDDWVLKEHWIMGKPTLPGTTYVELITSVMKNRHPNSVIEINNIYFLAPLTINEDSIAEFEIEINKNDDIYDFTIKSHAKGANIETAHANGSVSIINEIPKDKISLSEIENRCIDKEITNPEEIAYLAKITTLGEEQNREEVVEFGERWKNISWIKLAEDEGLALMELPADFASEVNNFNLHPSLLDCAVAFLRPFKYEGIFLPLTYRDLKIFKRIPERFYSHLKIAERGNQDDEKGTINFTVTLFNDDGEILATVDRFSMREIDLKSLKQSSAASSTTTENPVAKLQKTLIAGGIKNNEGIKAFSLAMNVWTSRIIVSTYDFDYRLSQYNQTKVISSKKREKRKKEDFHPRPELKNAYVAPKNETEEKITEIWRELLGIDKVGIQDDVFELGAHSLLLVEFHKELKESLETDISVVDLYKYTTIESLANYLLNSDDNDENLLAEVAVRAEKKKEAKKKRKKRVRTQLNNR